MPVGYGDVQHWISCTEGIPGLAIGRECRLGIVWTAPIAPCIVSCQLLLVCLSLHCLLQGSTHLSCPTAALEDGNGGIDDVCSRRVTKQRWNPACTVMEDGVHVVPLRTLLPDDLCSVSGIQEDIPLIFSSAACTSPSSASSSIRCPCPLPVPFFHVLASCQRFQRVSSCLSGSTERGGSYLSMTGCICAKSRTSCPLQVGRALLRDAHA